MKNVLRILGIVLVFTVFSARQAAFSSEQLPSGFSEYTLENGLNVFIFEDLSSAPVRIEFTSRAGFSSQTPETSGFFPLYARLFKNAGKSPFYAQHGNELRWLPADAESSCAADSSRYILTVSAQQTETALEQLSLCAFAPIFSDDEIKSAFSSLKNEVMQNAESTEGFINASIDSRVFSAAPWKQDSGIYPAIFTSTPLARARTMITRIAQTEYTPQNSALFISGGISTNTAFAIVQKYFGRFSAGPVSQKIEMNAVSESAQRKYVLVSGDFSDTLTQIVVQYTTLGMTEADIASAIFGAYGSTFKTQILLHKDLAVRGDDYIDVAAAHKNGFSRLIFQSLLEKSKNISPVKQIDQFVQCIERAPEDFSSDEADKAREKLIAEYKARFTNSASFMEMLSQFWAIETVDKKDTLQSPAERLVKRADSAAQTDIDLIQKKLIREKPFVFVLMNSSVYAENAGGLKRAGYETITQNNGSWYTQKLYENIKKEIASDGIENEIKIPGNALEFAEQNKELFSFYRLSNGIPVSIKINKNSSSALFGLVISGGEIGSADNPGFETVMANALASNIQKEISLRRTEGTIDGECKVLSEHFPLSCMITVECLSADLDACVECVSHALIYGIIQPSLADSLVYDQRSQKRIADASPVNQLYSAAVRKLYSQSPYTTAFAAGKEILSDTSYTEILSAYPKFLDAARYTVIITGNVHAEEIRDKLENEFGVLSRKLFIPPEILPPNFPDSKKILVKLTHQFFTDVSAENAGPMPPVLIPTKDFSDPVQYWIKSPDPASSDFAPFNALMYELTARLQARIQKENLSDCIVQLIPADGSVHAGILTFLNVKHTNVIDGIYKNEVTGLLADLSGEMSESVTSEIQGKWVLNALSGTQTNRGTALLIKKGIETPAGKTDDKQALQYLDDYEAVSGMSAAGFASVMQKYIFEQPHLRLYSADSKK